MSPEIHPASGQPSLVLVGNLLHGSSANRPMDYDPGEVSLSRGTPPKNSTSKRRWLEQTKPTNIDAERNSLHSSQPRANAGISFQLMNLINYLLPHGSTFRVESSRIIPNYLRICRTWSLRLPTNCYACFAAPNERAGGTDKQKHSQPPYRLRLPLLCNRTRMPIQTTLRTGLM